MSDGFSVAPGGASIAGENAATYAAGARVELVGPQGLIVDLIQEIERLEETVQHLGHRVESVLGHSGPTSDDKMLEPPSQLGVLIARMARATTNLQDLSARIQL